MSASAIRTLAGILTLFAGTAAMQAQDRPRSFAEDVEFLRTHTKVIVLGAEGGPQVAIAPAWQGRVMTSTAGGKAAPGYGWINDELIAGGKTLPHMNPWGGEDRFWMGPEGGQFGIFFKQGDPFDFEHWQTPAVIDTEAFDADSEKPGVASFRKTTSVTNASGTKFDVQIERSVRLISADAVAEKLGAKPSAAVKWVAYESSNTIRNAGKEAWKPETGLLSIWILGMFKPAPHTTVVIPFREVEETKGQSILNDAYFGKVPADRLKVDKRVVYFKGDGAYRSKIGVGPKRVMPVAGSWDPDARVLTIVHFDLTYGTAGYVNSMWENQKEPYGGDVVNSYNDGPPGPGKKPLGPFYELETSSAAAALAPGESLSHTHRTYHFTGEERDLEPISRAVLGVGLSEIAGAFAK